MIAALGQRVRAFIAGKHPRGSHLIRIVLYEPGSDRGARAFARRESRGKQLAYRQIEFHIEQILPRGRGVVNIVLNDCTSVVARCANDNR